MLIIFDLNLSFVVLYVNTLPILLCHKKKQVQGFLHTCNVSTNMVWNIFHLMENFFWKCKTFASSLSGLQKKIDFLQIPNWTILVNVTCFTSNVKWSVALNVGLLHLRNSSLNDINNCLKTRHYQILLVQWYPHFSCHQFNVSLVNPFSTSRSKFVHWEVALAAARWSGVSWKELHVLGWDFWNMRACWCSREGVANTFWKWIKVQWFAFLPKGTAGAFVSNVAVRIIKQVPGEEY